MHRAVDLRSGVTANRRRKGAAVYDTPRAALGELTDATTLERVAVAVLQTRHPQLRITGPTGDLNRDGFDRPLFGDHDETVLAVSYEKPWTTKLQRDFKDYTSLPAAKRPKRGIFVTTSSTKQETQEKYKKLIKETTGIELEIFDVNELDQALRSDALHSVAERELHVRPRAPRTLQTAATARERLAARIDGFDAPLVARGDEMGELARMLASSVQGGPRLLVIEGAGGVGKTRSAIEAATVHGTTLVAGSGVAVTPESLVDLPVDEPAVLIVDDAHRARDLTGLPALFNDPRYDKVSVILTMRGGYADRTLDQAGLGDQPTGRLGLGTLDREDIDEIVRGHGINDATFSTYVIALARGNPLIAHAMANEAAAKGSYGWTDVANLMRRLVTRRLIPTDDDRHRAAAVALAALTSADSGTDAAKLATAITGLPPQPHEIDALLADLTDNGLADGPPYVLRPDAVAVVLVADALAATGRVRLDLSAALKALGADAVPADYTGSAGALGIGAVPTGQERMTTEVRIPRLGAQLSVLAQAALELNDRAALGLLHRAVLDLLPVGADLAAWTDVLTLAQSVAPAQPRLLADLRTRLVDRWPPATPPGLFAGLDPKRHHAGELARLASAAGTLGERVAQADPALAVQWLLDVAYLIEPQVSARELDSLLVHLDNIAGIGRGDVAGGVWDDALRRRRVILDVVASWIGTRIGDNASAARVAWRALKPFLTMVAEGTDMGTVEAADTMVMTSYVLPATADVEEDLLRAVAEASRLLDAVADDGPSDIADALASLPRELRAIGLRGLPRMEGPLPADAVAVLDRAAQEVDAALASRWDRLPVAVRRAAADATLSYSPPGPRTLADASAAGSAVAAAAVADDELQRLLVVAPLEAEVVPGVDDEDYDAMQGHHTARAESLAATMDTAAGLQLLADAALLRAGFYGPNAMLAFARELGRRSSDTITVLTVVDEAELPGVAAELIRGLRDSHPEAVDRWLSGATTPAALSAAIAISDDLPEAVHDSLLTRAHEVACAQHPINSPSRPLPAAVAASVVTGIRETFNLARRPWRAPQRVRELLSARNLTAGTVDGDDIARLELAAHLARHQAWCQASVETRLSRLAALAVNAPIAAIPAVMMPVSYLLRHNQESDVTVPEEVLTNLVEGLHRYLDARGPFDAAGADVATGAATLMRWAPRAMARMLLERLQASGGVTGLPYEWRPYVIQLPDDARARLVTAYIELLPQVTRDGDNVVRREALTLLVRLGGGSDPLLALVRQWVNGSEQDRARAAVALADAWHLPDWPDLVADLLASGLTTESVQELARGIEPHSFGPDIAERMRPRLAALGRLADRDVPAAQDFAERARAIVLSAIRDYEADAESRRRGY